MSLALGLLLGGLATGLVGSSALAFRKVHRLAEHHPPGGDFVEVRGVQIHYRRTGDPDRPPVLVLHGAASNLEEPRLALADSFADEHVIWLDRPGLGWSQRPAGSWSPGREAELIADFLTALDIPQAVIIGHSWGGAIATRIAIDHPDRVDGLVLVAPALSPWIGEAAWFNKATFWPVLGPSLSRIVVPLIGDRQAQAGAARAFHPEPMPEDYVRRTGLPLLFRPQAWLANADDMARVNHHLADQHERYADISHPVVLIAGKPDTVLWSERHAGDVAERLPNAELRWIRKAGHNLHHHHPLEVLRAVHDIRGGALTKRPRSAGAAP
ncbi:alpha/beta fold hydrolase [Maricaulis sp. CAU 1757]